jgi:hypothetical protein
MLIHIIRFEVSGQQENGIGTGLGGSHPPFRKGRGKRVGHPYAERRMLGQPPVVSLSGRRRRLLLAPRMQR